MCGREKCAFTRRPTSPGVHGPTQRRVRLSSFGIQLREKQKARRLYRLMEKQFAKYVAEASQKTGNTAEILVQLLEMRLDNVVYRLGFGKTRGQAKQMVSHGFIMVNGVSVDVPSYRVRTGDVITIKESKQKKNLMETVKTGMSQGEIPLWLSRDAKVLSGKVTSLPEGADLKQVFDPTLIVEYYSR